MGASGWDYVVPYQEDLSAALDDLRHQVFAAGEYLKPSEVLDLPDPGSVDDLTEDELYEEFMGESGTHSIIDVFSVIPADSIDEDFGTVRPLTGPECLKLFGTARPGLAKYEPLAGSERLHDYVTRGRWTGRTAVLWDNDAPARLVFWGYSGD